MASVARRPLFGGYVLVAAVIAWVGGIALRALGPLDAVPPGIWLALAAACALAVTAALVMRQSQATGASTSHARGASDTATYLLLSAGLLGMFFALGAARAAATDAARDPASVARLAQGESVMLRGEVSAEPDLRAGYRYLTVDTSAVSLDGGQTWQHATGHVETAVSGPDDWFAPAYGDTVELNGKLALPGASYVPPGVLARMTGTQATVLSRGGGNPLLAGIFTLRVALAQGLQHTLPEPEAALLIGILLGLKTPVLRARLPLFTRTGTIHLVVPAGLKVSTLAELAGATVRRLGRWPQTLLALSAVAIYATLGGGGPAAIRAAIMGALLALAPALGRGYNVFTALALAVLAMTAVEPLVIYDAGFQLTVLATFALPLLVPPLAGWLAARLGRLPAAGAIAESLAVTVVAEVASLPVLALTFHQLSLVAPLANLLVVPLLAPLLVLGALLAGAALLTSAVGALLALALAWVTWPLLWYVDAAINACAALPAAALPVGDVPAFVALLYAAAFVITVWLLWPRLRAVAAVATVSHRHAHFSRGGLALLLVVAALGSCGAAVPALATQTTRIDFLAVGPGGEATLVRLPNGTTVLINGGPDGPTLETALAGKIPLWHRRLDLALLTDPRAGDVRGLEDAATHFAIGRIADAGMAHPSTDYIAWLDAARQAGATRTQIREGDVVSLATDTRFEVLAPPLDLYPPGQGDTTASDDLILRLVTPGLRLLYLGSADDYALDALAGAGEPLAADVVEVTLAPGEKLDLTNPLGHVLLAAHPRLVVIASAPIAPGSLTAQRLASLYPWDTDANAATTLGAYIYRLDTAGSIELSGGATGWSLG
jgi:competence protein ComEC